MEIAEVVVGLAVVAAVFYGVLLAWVYRRLRKVDGPIESNEGCIKELSVIVPFHNEADRMPGLIRRLSALEIPEHFSFEVVFVDDRSTDGYRLPENLGFRFVRVESESRGKKRALEAGVRASRSPWILTLDADSRPQADLITSLSRLPSDRLLFLFGIRPRARSGAMAAFFDLEFVALQAVGLAMATAGKPILANGAALLFQKDAYCTVRSDRNDWHQASGDDVFLLLAVKRRFGSRAIAVVPPPGGVVEVRFPGDFRDLFTQRLRWISKNGSISDPDYRGLAWFTLVVHLLWVMGLIAAVANGYWIGAAILAALKFAPEFVVLYATVRRLDRRDLTSRIPLSLIAYPFYLCILVAFGIFTRTAYIDE